MFGTLRKHSQPLWIAIIIGVVISFVIFFTPNYDPFDSGPAGLSADEAVVEEARGQVLISDALDEIRTWPRQRQQFAQQLIQAGRMQEAIQLIQNPSLFPPQLSAQRTAGQFGMRDLNQDGYEDINGLEYRARVRVRMLALAKNLGIVISDGAVAVGREDLVKNLFQTQYNPDNLRELLERLNKAGFLASGRAGEAQFDAFVRTDRILQQLQEMMTRSAGFWPDAHVAELYAQQNREYNVEAVFIHRTNYPASVTNFTALTNHYNKVANEYFVPERRTVAYVKLAHESYEARARQAVEFNKLVQARIQDHNTSTNKLTDLNGTALPNNATNLAARAEAAVRQGPAGQRLDSLNHEYARADANAFRKALFAQRPFATANLQAAVTGWNADTNHITLAVQTNTVTQADPSEEVPFELARAAFTARLQPGRLLESAVYASDGVYVLGLQAITPGRARTLGELDEKEKAAVRESFIEAESLRLAQEAGKSFRAAALATLKEGATFHHVATNAGLSVVTLPAFTLFAPGTTNHTEALEGTLPLSTIQNSLHEHEEAQAGKADKEQTDLSEFTDNPLAGPGAAADIAGFIFHITSRKESANPEARSLQEFATRVRDNTRTQSAAADWFQSELRQLNNEIILGSLRARKEDIGRQILQTEERIRDLNNLITGLRKAGQTQTASGVTLQGLEADLAKDEEELRNLIHDRDGGLDKAIDAAEKSIRQ